MKRFIAIWLARWPTDCRRRPSADTPFALTCEESGGIRLYSVDAAAAMLGLEAGMTLANARAMVPNLAVAPATPERDEDRRRMLADWCGRFSPWCALDDGDGIRLEITGVAHLFGGEEKMLSLMLAKFQKMRITAQFGLTDTPAVAWAAARFAGQEIMIVPPGAGTAFMADLPVRALRLDEKTVAGLEKVGLRKVSDLYDLPRAPLELRFGRQLLSRLDQVSGQEAEPISPLRPAAAFRTRLSWPDPIGLLSDIEAAADELAVALCRQLERHGKGARRLELALYRADGEVIHITFGTSAPSRDARHMIRLLGEKLPDIDIGFGVDAMIFSALETAPQQMHQSGFVSMQKAEASGSAADGQQAFSQLVDRLASRIGAGHVFRLVPFDSHDPERAFAVVPAMTPPVNGRWPARQPRPVRLLPVPERMKMMFEGPRPARYAWRQEEGGVSALEGPERISPEWWRLALETRDYFRLEAASGQRFWIFAAPSVRGAKPLRDQQWYMHGFFG
ncbi:DNA polymerase Y family protein [Sneathiella chungangensis]|uniref:DNA-directed DNA polymerase n=1 Tax=Sneathiella chungangensis TaxID=1418234 RepID=A0A845MFK5_9PROT|nr:DNA polymerase Y family protein [Sneathiella chungangensis]MZR22037.1 DNA polymerase Y family protein [Sneathiella chungangensis]